MENITMRKIQPQHFRLTLTLALFLVLTVAPLSLGDHSPYVTTQRTYAQDFDPQAPATVDPQASPILATPSTQNNDPTPDRCAEVGVFNGGWVNCQVGYLVTWLSTWALTIGAKILDLAAQLFNTLIDQTVLHFNDWYNNLSNVIETTWKGIRDLMNILIIGLFTFIAITIILGMESFGQKRLIAHALIVAVLINFSLLFTKIIINSSNFVSAQLFTTLSLPANDAASGKTADQGIAGKFIDFMGLTTLENTKGALRNMAQDDNVGIGMVLMHGFLGMLFFLLAAALLAYGAMLLLARAIFFILLLMTSSFAFVTYMFPPLQSMTIGWDNWWNSLLRNAMLAPVLLLLLAVVLNLAAGIKKITGGIQGSAKGSLGTIGTDNANIKSDISVFLAYAVILAFLYAAIKIADSFSSAVSRFGVRASKAIAGTGYGVTKGTLIGAGGAGLLTGGAALGAAMRNTVGKGADTKFRELLQKAKKDDRALTPKEMREAQRLDRIRNSSFNLAAGSKSLQSLAGGMFGKNLAKTLAGEGGFRGINDKKATEIVKQEKKFGMSQKEREDAAQEAAKLVPEQVRNSASSTPGVTRAQEIDRARDDAERTKQKATEDYEKRDDIKDKLQFIQRSREKQDVRLAAVNETKEKAEAKHNTAIAEATETIKRARTAGEDITESTKELANLTRQRHEEISKYEELAKSIREEQAKSEAQESEIRRAAEAEGDRVAKDKFETVSRLETALEKDIVKGTERALTPRKLEEDAATRAYVGRYDLFGTRAQKLERATPSERTDMLKAHSTARFIGGAAKTVEKKEKLSEIEAARLDVLGKPETPPTAPSTGGGKK